MQRRLVTPVSRCLRWLASPSASRVWQALAGLSLVVSVGLLVQHFGGGPLETKIPVGPAAKVSVFRQGTGTYRWRLPSRYNNQVMEYRAVMLENGRPMSRCERSADVSEIQATHFYIHNSFFLFGSGDGSDVRSNGRRYEVRLPVAVRLEWLVVALSVLVLSLAFSLRAAPGWQRRWLPWAGRMPAWAVGVAVLSIGLGDLVLDPTPTHGSMLIKGTPESDAAGWHDFGLRLAEGDGLDSNYFGAQRPLYAVFVGALTLVAGPSLLPVKVLNVVFVALAAMGIFILGRTMRAPWAGLGAAAYLALGKEHLHALHMVLTETPGMALGVIASLTLVWAVRRKSVWGCMLAGVVAGICSLTSGELILTLPLNALLVVCVARTWPLKGRLLGTFVLGASLIILPWMGIQKARFGVFTLTMNTPELLSGGSDPVHGKLDKAMHEEANAKGFDSNNTAGRYRYFSERFASNVRADPAGYAVRVMKAAAGSLDAVRANEPMLRLMLVLTVLGSGLVGTLRWRAVQPLLLAGALVLFLTNEDDAWPALWLTLPVLTLAAEKWRGRRWLALGVVLSTMLACMLLCGLSGNVASRRFWHVADWALVLLWLMGAAGLMRLIFSGWARVPVLNWGMAKAPTLTAAPVGRLNECRGLALGCVAASGLALVIVLARHPFGQPQAYGAASVGTVQPAGDSQAVLVQFDDYTASIGKWEHLPHWRPYYAPAKEAHWVARPRLIQKDGKLGVRVILDGVTANVPVPKAGQTALCIGVQDTLKDGISGGPVHVLRVREIKAVDLNQ